MSNTIRETSMYEAAQAYQDSGIIVHPLYGPDAQVGSPGKQPMLKDWSKRTQKLTDTELSNYFEKGDCNIGAVCGFASNLVAIDIDWYVKGIWDAILKGIDASNWVKQQRTDGRWHWLFKYNSECTLTHAKPLGFDLISNGGNLVLSPSVHASGEVYHISGDIAARPELPPEVIHRLKSVFSTLAALRVTLNKCRKPFGQLFNALFTDDKSNLYHDLSVFRGMEGRKRMLHLCAELKANGADENQLLLLCMLAFGDEYNEQHSRSEISHINEKATAKTDTIKADPILSQFYDEKCEVTGERLIKNATMEEIRQLRDSDKERRLVLNLPDNHFITHIVTYISGLSDTYIDYQIVAGLWLLSALCRGKLVLDLKQEEVRPNLYIMLLGQSSVSRKTTALDKVSRLYEAVTEEPLYNDMYSLEGYLELLHDETCLNLVRDEAAGLHASFNKKHNDGIYDIDCAIYDRKPVRKTLSSGRDKKKKEVVVEKTYVTHLYATTPDKFTSTLPYDAILSGYAPRFIYVYPRYSRPRKPLDFKDADDADAHTAVLADVIRLNNLFKEMEETKVIADPGVMEYFSEVMFDLERQIAEKDNDILSTAFSRSQIHILKIAMLLEVGTAIPSFVIQMDTMKTAIQMVIEVFLPTYMEIVERMQEDIKTNQIEKVIYTLRRLGGSTSHSDLLRNSKLKKRDFDECITTMIDSGEVQCRKEIETGKTYYILCRGDKNTELEVNPIHQIHKVPGFTHSAEDSVKMVNSIDRGTNDDLGRATIMDNVSESGNPVKPVNLVKSPPSQAVIENIFKWMQDWEAVYKTQINSTNCEDAAREYADKHNADFEQVLYVVKKYAGIPVGTSHTSQIFGSEHATTNQQCDCGTV